MLVIFCNKMARNMLAVNTKNESIPRCDIIGIVIVFFVMRCDKKTHMLFKIV